MKANSDRQGLQVMLLGSYTAASSLCYSPRNRRILCTALLLYGNYYLPFFFTTVNHFIVVLLAVIGDDSELHLNGLVMGDITCCLDN